MTKYPLLHALRAKREAEEAELRAFTRRAEKAERRAAAAESDVRRLNGIIAGDWPYPWPEPGCVR